MILNKEKKRKIAEIAKQYNLSLVLLFGSFASGKIHAKSDLDIAIQGQRGQTLFSFNDELAMIGKFTEIFKGKKIDLCVINRANPLLLKQINQNCQLFFGKLRDFYNFKIYAFNRYNDYKRFFEMEAKIVREQVNSFLE